MIFPSKNVFESRLVPAMLALNANGRGHETA